MIRCLLLALLLGQLLGLSACVTQPVPRGPLSQTQLERLSQLDRWQFSARLALRHGDDGGSGRFEWLEQPELSDLSFVGAFGQGSWRLQVTPQQAQLELAADEVYTAADVPQLLEQTLGWQIPVHALSWWIRGLPMPGVPYESIQGQGDQLETLQQLGWQVEYASFSAVDSLLLPRKLTASRGSEQLKMVIKRWQLNNG